MSSERVNKLKTRLRGALTAYLTGLVFGIKRALYRAKELGVNKTAPQVEEKKGLERWTGNPPRRQSEQFRDKRRANKLLFGRERLGADSACLQLSMDATTYWEQPCFYYYLMYPPVLTSRKPTTHNRGCMNVKQALKIGNIRNMCICSFPDRKRTCTINIPDRLFTLTTEASPIRRPGGDNRSVCTFCECCLAEGKRSCWLSVIWNRNDQLLDGQVLRAMKFPQALHQVWCMKVIWTPV